MFDGHMNIERTAQDIEKQMPGTKKSNQEGIVLWKVWVM